MFGLVGCDCVIYSQESNGFCSCWNCCILMSATNGATNSHHRVCPCNLETCGIWWLKAIVLELYDIVQVHVSHITVVCQIHKFQQKAKKILLTFYTEFKRSCTTMSCLMFINVVFMSCGFAILKDLTHNLLSVYLLFMCNCKSLPYMLF